MKPKKTKEKKEEPKKIDKNLDKAEILKQEKK